MNKQESYKMFCSFSQAVTWIKQMEGSNLKMVDSTDANCIKIVEQAVRMGQPLMICNFPQTFDAELKPLLEKQIFHR